MVSRTRAIDRVILALVGVLATIAGSLATSDQSTTPTAFKSPIFREAQDFTGPAGEETTSTLAPIQSSGRDVKLKDSGVPRGSVAASDRIMRELKAIYKSDAYKSGAIKIKLVDDNFYKWDVRMPVLDNESDLYNSMLELKNQGKDDHIKFRIAFNDEYPKAPPLIRVLYPTFDKGEIGVINGILCLDIITKAGWNPKYSIETMMLSILDGFVAASKKTGLDVNGDIVNPTVTDEGAREVVETFANFHKDDWK